MSIELRAPTREDAPAIADVIKSLARGVGIDPQTAAEVESWFDVPSLDLERDARVALVDGQIVGYVDVSDGSSEGRFLWIDLRVVLDHTSVAPLMLDFAERRAGALARPDGVMKIWGSERDENMRELAGSRGYALHHYSLRMRKDLAEKTPAAVWPEGIGVRTFRRGEDDRRVYETHQESFADQRDFARDPFDEWQHWSFHDPFDPSLWFLATDGDEIAGISLCRPERGGDLELGWVQILGVRKPWRRRGLGLALLLHSFGEFRVRGKKRAGLGVDADNPTGAVRLYERAGMAVERKYVWYEKPAK